MEAGNVRDWLLQTTRADAAQVKTASDALQHALTSSKVDLLRQLLSVTAEGEASPAALPAVLFLKNTVKREWGSPEFLPPSEKKALRDALLGTALASQGKILSTLCEALRLVVADACILPDEDGDAIAWPSLVPTLSQALQHSDLVLLASSGDQNAAAQAPVKAFTVLSVVASAVRPFQYFLHPDEEHEAVPATLEAISQNLLVPLLPLLHLLVQQAEASRDAGASQYDACLHVLLKTLHRAIRSHMPASIKASIDPLIDCLLRLTRTVTASSPQEDPQHEPRLRAQKRALQICLSLAQRHSDLLSPEHMEAMADAATSICRSAATVQGLCPLQKRILSVGFDVLAGLLDSSQGWRVLSPHFALLVQEAVFPFLCLKEEDMELWEEDDAEFLRLILPTETDDFSSSKDDFYVPRRSAANLLGLIATSKGPPAPSPAKAPARGKKATAGANRKRRPVGGAASSAGAVLVLPFLSQFPVPSGTPGAPPGDDAVAKYSGVLFCYASLLEYLSRQDSASVGALFTQRVLPLYAPGTCAQGPLLATANWLLGELCSCIPEQLIPDTFSALGQTLAVPDPPEAVQGGGAFAPSSWHIVRASAGRALGELIQGEVEPPDWLALLQLIVAATRQESEGEMSVAFELLETAAHEGGAPVKAHLPAMIEAVVADVSRVHLGGGAAPRRVWLSLSALASMVEAWDDDDDDDDDDEEEEEEEEEVGASMDSSGAKGENGGVSEEEKLRLAQHLAHILGDLLLHLWGQAGSAGAGDGDDSTEDASLVASFDGSILLDFVLRQYAKGVEGDSPSSTVVEQVLGMWAEECADWSAWEEDEDAAVCAVIAAASEVQRKRPLPHFSAMPTPPPPAPPVAPRCPAEAMGAFLCAALEDASGVKAVKRSSRAAHALLLVSQPPARGGLAVRFSQACLTCLTATMPTDPVKRLGKSTKGKALSLCTLMCSCVLAEPSLSLQVLSTHGVGGGFALDLWLRALSLSLAVEWREGELRRFNEEWSEAELKLVILCLGALLGHLKGVSGGTEAGRVGSFMRAMLDAALVLKKQEEDEEDMSEEGEEDEMEEREERDRSRRKGRVGKGMGEEEEEDEDEEDEDEEEEEEEDEDEDEEEEEQVGEGVEIELEMGPFESTDLSGVLQQSIMEHKSVLTTADRPCIDALKAMYPDVAALASGC